MDNMEDEIFKPLQNTTSHNPRNAESMDFAYSKIKSQEEEIKKNLEYVKGKKDDLVFISSIAYALVIEKENTNRILKNLLTKIDFLEKKINILENKKPKEKNELSPADEQIIEYIKEKKMVCAEDIRKKMKYKRKNAASQRLSKLVTQDVLIKLQKGRKVFFKMADD